MISKKKIVSDIVWSVFSLGCMNVMAQFVLYPLVNRTLGTEQYGIVLYLIGIINILATSFGISANLARLKSSVNEITANLDSVLWLVGACLISLPIAVVLYINSGLNNSFVNILLFWILVCATIWRFYADVEYRLSLNYKGYFCYYLLITIGYGFGIILYKITRYWQLLLLPGEIAGLLFVGIKGTIFRRDITFDKERLKRFLHIVVHLMISQLMINVVLNADRLVLQHYYTGVEVAQYYIASLVGKTMALITSPLNSVIIGHLAKTKKPLSANTFLKYALYGLGGIAVVLIGCYVGSHLFAYLFYPAEYKSVIWLFLPANLAQIFYFAVGILTTVLLRYINERFQTIINVFYVAIFLIVTIPATIYFGLRGFAYGLLFTNCSRYIFASIVGFVELKKERGKE